MKIITLYIFFVLATFSCNKRFQASAECKSIDSFESKLGVLNLNTFEIGRVVALNLKNKNATTVTTLPFLKDDILEEKINRRVNISIERDFQIVFAGETSKIEDVELAKVEITNRLNRASDITLNNSRINSLRNPFSFIKREVANTTLLTDLQSHEESTVFFLVHEVAAVDSLNIKLSNDVLVGNDIKVVEVGGVKFDITVKCNSSLQLDSSAAFFKPTFFKLSSDGKNVERYNEVVNLRDYNFNYTLLR